MACGMIMSKIGGYWTKIRRPRTKQSAKVTYVSVLTNSPIEAGQTKTRGK